MDTESNIYQAALAHDKVEYQKAITLLEEEVKAGSVIAHYFLGLCFLNGNGPPQDSKVACAWFEEAGRMGFKRGILMAKMLKSEINAIPEPFSDILATQFELLLLEWARYESPDDLYREAVELGGEATDTTAQFRSLFLFFQAALDGSQEAHVALLADSGSDLEATMNLNATAILGSNHGLRLLGHKGINARCQGTQIRVGLSFRVVVVNSEVDFEGAKHGHGVPQVLD